jgi:cation diffusion facilitator CzcD-associated flavoprotein CzcO
VAKIAEQVDVYQRTPQWILPRSDKPFSEEDKRRFARNKRAAKKHRDEIYWAFEKTIAFRYEDGAADGLKALALSHIDYRIKDEALKAKLTPDYPFGCKRTLICSDFYKALLRDNVELVTDRIRCVTKGGVVTVDDKERAADVIVLATGFKATEYLEGIEVVGRGGGRLHDDWAKAEVAHAYKGLTVSGYPNFFMMYGPNTNQGGNSIIIILEAQATYIMSALGAMRRHRAKAVDVRREVMDAYNKELAEALDGTLWHDGCNSYFKNAAGKIATQLPQTSRWYADQTKRFKMKEYERV